MCRRRVASRALPAIAVIALFAWLAPTAQADQWDKKTFLTFSGPVQIPGATLTAGTYTFELADPDVSRHVIRVRSQDGTKVYGLFMTIPAQRAKAPDENVIMFAERAAGAPPAIEQWFYPGEASGEEFVYPKSQALAIAKANHREVLATEMSASGSESQRMAAMQGSSVSRIDESGKMTSVNKAPTPQPAPAPRANAAPPAAAPSLATTRRSQTRTAATTGQTSAPRTLPATASDLPLVELLCGLFFAGAVVAHQLRRRYA